MVAVVVVVVAAVTAAVAAVKLVGVFQSCLFFPLPSSMMTEVII